MQSSTWMDYGAMTVDDLRLAQSNVFRLASLSRSNGPSGSDCWLVVGQVANRSSLLQRDVQLCTLFLEAVKRFDLQKAEGFLVADLIQTRSLYLVQLSWSLILFRYRMKRFRKVSDDARLTRRRARRRVILTSFIFWLFRLCLSVVERY